MLRIAVRTRSLALALLLLASSSARGETPFRPVRLADLPAFEEDVEERVTKTGRVYPDGLVSTVNCEQFKTKKLKAEQGFHLPASVTGFSDEIDARIIWQDQRAPLAVLLQGTYGREDDVLARKWKELLYASGCHVLAFDSVFHRQFNKRSGQGPQGNVRAEAEVVAQLISALLQYSPKRKQPPLMARIRGVRLIGASYGGYVALNVARLPQSRDWPLDRVLAFSTPVRLGTAIELLDQFHRNDEPAVGLDILMLLHGYTPEENPPAGWEHRLIRAGIGYTFYAALRDVLPHVESRYMPNLRKQFRRPPNGADDLRRLDTFSNWSFSDYMNRGVAPYWGVPAGQLLEAGDLTKLLPGTPDFVQAVLAEDDPLNRQKEVVELKAAVPDGKVLAVPYGGHLGFCGTKWTRALVMKFFQP